MTDIDLTIPDFLRRVDDGTRPSRTRELVTGRRSAEKDVYMGPSERYMRSVMTRDAVEAALAIQRAEAESAARAVAVDKEDRARSGQIEKLEKQIRDVRARQGGDAETKIRKIERRVARLKKKLHGGDDAAPEGARDADGGQQDQRSASVCTGENIMAEKKKRVAKKSANGEVRDTSVSAGNVSDFHPARSGTAKALLIEMAGSRGGATADELTKALAKVSKSALSAHLFCLKRDSGIGHEIASGKVTLKFPGSKTVKDAVLPEVEKKKKAA